MKYIILRAAFLALIGAAPLAAFAQSDSCAVIVNVFGFRNANGDLGVAVFSSPDGWPEANEKAVFHHEFPIQGDEATAQFTLPLGRYAIAVKHDQNENEKIHRNFMGKTKPKEGFGFSNNPEVRHTLPGFEDAAFRVACPSTELAIALDYK